MQSKIDMQSNGFCRVQYGMAPALIPKSELLLFVITAGHIALYTEHARALQPAASGSNLYKMICNFCLSLLFSPPFKRSVPFGVRCAAESGEQLDFSIVSQTPSREA